MAGSTERDAGFLARWSRLKAQARRDGTDAAESVSARTGDAARPVDPGPQAKTEPVPAPESAAQVAPPAEPKDADAEPPPLTLADVARLTRESDFRPFVAPGVDTDVKNAALKKLFSDPHFNVMDGLDVYIDDYNKPDPLPSGMLLKMVQANALGLVKQGVEAMIQDAPAPVTQGSIAVEPRRTAGDTPADALPADKIAPDEDADLQLQPHDAAGRVDLDPRPGENGGHQH